MKPFVVLVGGLALTSALASPAYAGGIKKYYDKASFLAQTAATSATGPLPDAGLVLDVSTNPLGTYPLGSLVFSLAPGSDNVAVGAAGTAAAPDWYPQTPGNDMALGWERVQVSTTGPVYSFGFDIVEPDATMPPFGGTPEESTYEFLLFNGPAFVGRVEFDGASIPNDVETFIGVWSDQPFDRVIINDITGSDDDEFYGEFYTGDTPLGCTMKVTVSYAAATLTIDVTLGSTIPRTWNLWIVHGKKAATRQFAVAIPVLPVETRRLSIPLTPRGEVGILSTLQKAGEGVACSAFETVSTKP
jgi:hypothetical protein